MKFIVPVFCILFVTHSFACSAQSLNKQKDSVLLAQISQRFFDWYISSAKSNKWAEYNPIEVEDKNGMTTLDFSTYFKNLKEYSFSDSLLKKERMSYDGCVLKLSKIKYEDYLKLTDLGDFEELEDDFTNYYRWTGGQEMFDKYVVSKVECRKQSTIVYGRLYTIDSTGKIIVEGQIATVFIKEGAVWKILDITY